MIWLIAVIIWAVILLLPKIYNGLEVIFSLAILYRFREAFNAWANRHVILAITLSVLFFGSIIALWLAKQIQITRDNKRIDAENAEKKAAQNQYVLFFELPLDDYAYLRSFGEHLFDNVARIKFDNNWVKLYFKDGDQISQFQLDIISAQLQFGMTADDDITPTGQRIEGIYDQYFVIGARKVNTMDNTRENWANLLHSKLITNDFADDDRLQFFFMPYSTNPILGMLVLWNTATGFGASIGKIKKPDAVTRVYSVDEGPQYYDMYHAN